MNPLLWCACRLAHAKGVMEGIEARVAETGEAAAAAARHRSELEAAVEAERKSVKTSIELTAQQVGGEGRVLPEGKGRWRGIGGGAHGQGMHSPALTPPPFHPACPHHRRRRTCLCCRWTSATSLPWGAPTTAGSAPRPGATPSGAASGGRPKGAGAFAHLAPAQ